MPNARGRTAAAAAPAGYLLVALAATSWGAQSVVVKLLLTAGTPTAALVSTRTALSAVLLTLAVVALGPRLLRVAADDLWRLVVIGVVGMAGSSFAYYSALTQIPVATAALLIYMTPVLVLTASAVFYRQRVRRLDLVATLVTVAGAALVVRAWEPAVLRVTLPGIAIGLGSAVAFTVFNLVATTVSPALSPWTMLTYGLGASTLFWLPIAAPWRLLLGGHPPAFWAGLAVVTLFGTLVPFALYLAGLRRISAAHASLTSTLEPVVATTVAWIVLGERLVWPQALGGLLVLAGIGCLHARR